MLVHLEEQVLGTEHTPDTLRVEVLRVSGWHTHRCLRQWYLSEDRWYHPEVRPGIVCGTHGGTDTLTTNSITMLCGR